jgi:hypothetical protein
MGAMTQSALIGGRSGLNLTSDQCYRKCAFPAVNQHLTPGGSRLVERDSRAMAERAFINGGAGVNVSIDQSYCQSACLAINENRTTCGLHVDTP